MVWVKLLGKARQKLIEENNKIRTRHE